MEIIGELGIVWCYVIVGTFVVWNFHMILGFEVG